MKLIVLAVLVLTAAAHAQTDYSLCNDTINRAFKKDKNFPFGFIQITSKGEIEAAQCGPNKNSSKCSISSFNRYSPVNENYKVAQDPINGPYKTVYREFKVERKGGKIVKIISGEDELQIDYTDKKCVATALIADIPEENLREMNFDIVACKSFYEIQKRYGTKLSDCYSKDIAAIKEATSESIRRIGSSCQNELQETYKHMVVLKEDIKSRYAMDPTLKRKPFVDIVPPSVFNDQVIENYICSYEAVFASSSSKKECGSRIFEITAPSETSIGVILGNKKTCGLIYSDETLSNEEIFKARHRDSLVYSLNLPDSRSSNGTMASRGSKGNAE